MRPDTYDVVFLLNRYFDVVGRAIEQAGGIANQFTGDGVMALFGVQTGAPAGCRQALAAAAGMVHGVAELSRTPGGGAGDTTAGGHWHSHRPGGGGSYGTRSGAVPDRRRRHGPRGQSLQELTKEYGCQLVISEPVAQRAGIEVLGFPRHELAVRNRRDSIAIRTIDDVQTFVRLFDGGQ